jgi:hypothetical protein
MKHFTSSFTLVLILVLSLGGRTQAAGVCTAAVHVTSPCEGLLIPEADAKEALACKSVLLPKAMMDLEKQQELWKVRERYVNELIQSYKEHSDGTNDLLDQALKEVVPSFPDWGSVMMGTSIGVIVGVVITVLLVSEVRR